LHITRKPGPESDQQIDALVTIGEDVVVVSTYDGHWRSPEDEG